MREEELWKAYCEKENIDIDTPYEAWGFGGAPDKLADLVLKGIKTATASGYDLYFIEGEEEPLPQPGDYSVILNSKDEAVCIIQTTKTTVVPFDEVSEEKVKYPQLNISLSVGGAEGAKDFDTFYDEADKALYMAKKIKDVIKIYE